MDIKFLHIYFNFSLYIHFSLSFYVFYIFYALISLSSLILPQHYLSSQHNCKILTVRITTIFTQHEHIRATRPFGFLRNQFSVREQEITLSFSLAHSLYEALLHEKFNKEKVGILQLVVFLQSQRNHILFFVFESKPKLSYLNPFDGTIWSSERIESVKENFLIESN